VILFRFVLLSWIVAQTFYFGGFGPDIAFIKLIHPHHVLFLLLFASFFMARSGGVTLLRRLELPERLLLLVGGIWVGSFVCSGAHYDETVYENKWLSALLNVTLYPYATFFLVRSFPYRKEFVVGVLKVICVLGIYLAFTGIFEHYELNWLVWPDYIMDPGRGSHFGRARGPFMESVAMGRVLTMVFVSWLVLQIESGPVLKGLAFLCVPAAMASIYFTQTRGPWIGFGLVCLAFILFKTPVRRTVYCLVGCILVAACLGLSHKFSLGDKNLFLERQTTVTDRVVTWLVSGQMIKAHPFVGIGYGRFNAEWDNYFKTFQGLDFTGFDGSHNTYLTMAAETGVCTLALYLLMAFLMWHRCFRVYRELNSNLVFERSFVVLVMGLFWMYLFTSWFSDLRWNTVQNTLMFLFLGVVAAMKEDLCDNRGAGDESLCGSEGTSATDESLQPAPGYAT
jgi:O-antigen ligase